MSREDRIDEMFSRACGAYWFYTLNHDGQWSDEYRKLCIVEFNAGYKPGALETHRVIYTDDIALEMYCKLAKSHNVPAYTYYLDDDGTLDTVITVDCMTCGDYKSERFMNIGRDDFGNIDDSVWDDCIEQLEDDEIWCNCKE
ncbi:MAG: hypothetical protein GY861_00885 [bacterium]|nr:hypothetical protein [bacterium]